MLGIGPLDQGAKPLLKQIAGGGGGWIIWSKQPSMSVKKDAAGIIGDDFIQHADIVIKLPWRCV